MTTAFLVPARLPTTHTTADDDDDGQRLGENGINIDYDYLRSLIVGSRNAGARGGQQTQRVFCVSLPQIAGVARSSGGYQSLTEPVVELEKDMAAVEVHGSVAETAPSSPPELSYSKSSTSSLESDSLSDDGSTEKLSHFEDVTLDGEERRSVEDCNLRPESRPTLKRPPPRSTTPTERRPNGATLPNNKSRENRYPALHITANGVPREREHTQNLHLPHGSGMRRTYTTPSSPSAMMHAPQRLSSRSPSPSRLTVQSGHLPSTHSAGRLTLRPSWDARSTQNGLAPRRQSWQPGRKTIKELEAEYNDEDEEVPEEAILENVPISPMPGQTRSKSPSPQRWPVHQMPHGLAMHANLHSSKVPKNAKRPSAPTIMPNGQYGSPRSPRHARSPMLPHSATIPSFLHEPFPSKHRRKSWTEELNAEARQLSAALEEYAERFSSEKLTSGTNSVSSSPPRPSMSKARMRTTILELPPVQKGSVMIDPLPISKEKEAVLTRTRPSWLPPKDPLEERRHLKQWECMMAHAADAEKKRILRLKEQAEDKEEQQSSNSRLWDEHILSNWDSVMADPGTRELWWQGVTPRSRPHIWQRAIGNELGLQPNSFEAALRRAHELEEKVAEMSPSERSNSREAAWLDAITRDTALPFPELDMFQPGAPLHGALSDVLKAYALYRSDVGYVYGTHLIAALPCMHLPPADAFVLLANLLNRALPLAFLVHDHAAMARAHDQVLAALKYKLPRLHAHLSAPSTGVRPEEYLDPLFRCLFAYNLPPEHVSRLWDVYVFEGDKVLVRAAVAVLGKLESKLYGGREEILELVGWRNERRREVGSEEEFIKAVQEAGKVEGSGGSRSP